MPGTTRDKTRSEKTHRRSVSGWSGIVLSGMLRAAHGEDVAFRWQSEDYVVERCSDGRVILSPAAAEVLADVIRREAALEKIPEPSNFGRRRR
jgi:hypothetical protein